MNDVGCWVNIKGKQMVCPRPKILRGGSCTVLDRTPWKEESCSEPFQRWSYNLKSKRCVSVKKKTETPFFEVCWEDSSESCSVVVCQGLRKARRLVACKTFGTFCSSLRLKSPKPVICPTRMFAPGQVRLPRSRVLLTFLIGAWVVCISRGTMIELEGLLFFLASVLHLLSHE